MTKQKSELAQAVQNQLPSFPKWEIESLNERTVLASFGSPEGFDIVIRVDELEGEKRRVSSGSIANKGLVLRHTVIIYGEDSPRKVWNKINEALNQMAQELTNILSGAQAQPIESEFIVWDKDARRFVEELSQADGTITRTDNERLARIFRGDVWVRFWKDLGYGYKIMEVNRE